MSQLFFLDSVIKYKTTGNSVFSLDFQEKNEILYGVLEDIRN